MSCPGPDVVRTDALVAAARDLVAEGLTPTVEDAAARADVSRTTAYRYFPNQTALLVAAHPEVATTSFLDETAPDDPVARVEQVLDRYLDVLMGSEAQQRTMLRLSLDPDLDDERRAALPLRQGRVIGWLDEALDPLADQWSAAERRRLACAMRAAAGSSPWCGSSTSPASPATRPRRRCGGPRWHCSRRHSGRARRLASLTP